MSTAGCSASAERSTPARPYLCRACGNRFADDYSVWRCTCGAPLWWDDARHPAELIAHPVDLGQGSTPLFEGAWDGRRVWFKHEGLNPTGSFKDRGVALIVNHALANGVTALAEDSSGNAGASFAAYCAAAGIACELYVPASASPGKLVQARAHAASVRLVEGPREASAEAAQNTRTANYAGHNWHPLFIEGVAALARELVADCPGLRQVIVPIGNGSLVLGLSQGFAALRDAGELDAVPRIVGVRAVTPGTIAEGIAIQATTHDDEVAAALEASNGRLYEVTDDQIIAAWRQACAQGLYIEPTSAAALAGLSLRCAEPTDIETTVVVLTGHGLKTPPDARFA